MDDCRNPKPSADEMRHEVEYGEHHMDGELCGMGKGDDPLSAPLSPEDIRRAMEVEHARA